MSSIAVHGSVPSLDVAAFGPPVTKFRALDAKLEDSSARRSSGITRVFEFGINNAKKRIVVGTTWPIENCDY